MGEPSMGGEQLNRGTAIQGETFPPCLTVGLHLLLLFVHIVKLDCPPLCTWVSLGGHNTFISLLEASLLSHSCYVLRRSP